MIKKSKISTIILTLLMITSVLLILSTDTTAKAGIPSNMLQYEWPQHQSDPEGTCFSDGPAPNAPNIKWKTQIPGVSENPVAFNGMVFVQVPYVATYALDGDTGEIVWTKYGVTGSIAKIDDYLMVIGNICVNTADGSIVWFGPPEFAISQVGNGAGYIAELQMAIDYNYGWNLQDPTQPPILAWNRTLEYNIGHGYINAYGNGKIFVGGEDGFMRGIDARTGDVIWESPSTSTSHTYGGVYIDGKVIHGGLDNNMYAWDAETGEKLWTYNPKTYYGQWASDAGAAYGMIYEHNQDNYLYAIDATTGEMVWRTEGPGIGYSGCLVIADGKVYSAMGENQYRDFVTGEYAYSEYGCFDAYTGDLLWTLPMETGAAYTLHECIAYGNLYVIPLKGTPSKPGVWDYFGGGSLGEVWCISSEVPDWGMFMSDPEHSAEGAGPTNLALKWKFQADAQIVSQPTLVDGVAYFGSLDSNIYAVDANTGTKIWNYTTDYQVASSLAVVNNKVFTGADDGSIHCLDAATGELIWETFAGGETKNLLGSGTYLCNAPPVRSSPMVVGNNVYVGALDGNLYCLNANSGSVIWKFETEGPIQATPTIVDNKIYFPSSTGGYPMYLGNTSPNADFYCLDATSGSLIWNKEIPYVFRTLFQGNHIQASPTVADGMVFVSNGFFYNYALNASTGETIWTRTQRFNPSEGSIQDGGIIQMNAPLYKYGSLYMNDFFGTVCLNATDGTEIWYTWLSRENTMQGLTYSFNRVYTVNELGVVYVLDALTGEKLSYYDTGGYQMHGSPTPYNGSLYVGCNDWNLYCFGEARLMGKSISSAEIALSLSTDTVVKGEFLYIEGNLVNVQAVVPLTVTVDNPDSTFEDITVMTDENGYFQIIYTPDIIGDLTIVAWCADGDFYEAGSSETLSLSIVNPEPTPIPESTLAPMTDTYLAGSTIAIIAAIAVVAFLILRKK